MVNNTRLQEIVEAYTGGHMCVIAVPGSGKTQLLASLTIKLLSENLIKPDQEILIVTLTNSAAQGLHQRILAYSQNNAYTGYKIKTLHSLSYSIIKERPELAGIVSKNGGVIVDDAKSQDIIFKLIQQWGNENLQDAMEISRLYKFPTPNTYLHEWSKRLLPIVYSFIKQAKDYKKYPEDFLKNDLSDISPLIKFSLQCYEQYHKTLRSHGWIDFSDLALLAIKSIAENPSFLQKLRYQWPYILEDEAQDSNLTQEELLSYLAEGGNWVRVGDPNQAIYETFTTATPQLLKQFSRKENVKLVKLDESCRSVPIITQMANELIHWVNESHPIPVIRDALSEPFIVNTYPLSPHNTQGKVYIDTQKQPLRNEIEKVLRSVDRWLKENPTSTTAILVPDNETGSRFVEVAERKRIPYIEMLRSEKTTSEIAQQIAVVLFYLANPVDTSKLSQVFNIWYHNHYNKVNSDDNKKVTQFIKKIYNVKTLLSETLKDRLHNIGLSNEEVKCILDFVVVLKRWYAAVTLPISHLVTIISYDLFTDDNARNIALRLIKKFIILNENIYNISLSEAARNFSTLKSYTIDPTTNGANGGMYSKDDKNQGKVIIITTHKAKGLEWDRVYLTGVNTLNYPNTYRNKFLGETWLNGKVVNINAELLHWLRATTESTPITSNATESARNNYIAERLRLLYVGITRAKQDIIITSNTGDEDAESPCEAVMYLSEWLQQQNIKT